MTLIFFIINDYKIYVVTLGLFFLFLAISFLFAWRVRRFAGSKKTNPHDEAHEKWNDHFRQICLNLSFVSLAAVTAISIFNLQRHQQAIFLDRDLADRAMLTVNDIINQQLEALKFIYMLDLRLPSSENDSTGFDIFRNAMVRASSEQQVNFSIVDLKRPFRINDLKIYDRKIYGYISGYDLASFSALTYTMNDKIDDLARVLVGEKFTYGLYDVTPDKKAQIENLLLQTRSIAAEYVISLCALYSRIDEAAARSDLGQIFNIEPTPDMRFADKLAFADEAIDAYLSPTITALRKLHHKSLDCAQFTKNVLRDGNAVIPYLRKTE